MNGRPTVVIACGNDILSRVVLAELAAASDRLGVRFQVFFTRDRRNGAAACPTWRDYLFWERDFLAFLDRNMAPQAESSPRFLVSKNLLSGMLNDVNVNDPRIVAGWEAAPPLAILSLRVFQRFSADTIARCAAMGTPLANLHPGIAPAYRGVASTFHAMHNRERCNGVTLHHIDANYDTGPIIDQCTRPLDYGRSVFDNAMDLAPLAVDLLQHFVREVAFDRRAPGCPQDRLDGDYFSAPTPEQTKALSDMGIPLVRSLDAFAFYTRRFPADATGADSANVVCQFGLWPRALDGGAR